MNSASADLPKRRPRGRLRRICFVLAAGALASVLALLAGEVFVRFYNPQVLFPRYVTDSPFGIRVNVPNARYWHTSPEMTAEFRINSMGIRSDREYAFEKPPGTLRIIGLGDSFTQGYEVNVEDTYLYRLEKMLKELGYSVEVINFGVSGYGNAEELIMLKEFGFRFDPDVVILGYFQNDLDDNVRSDLYRLDENDQLVRASATYLPAIGIRNRLYSFGLYRWLAAKSHLFALVRERMAAIVKRRMVQDNMAVVAGQEHDSQRTGADYGKRLAARLLDEVKAECDRRGSKFVLLDIPDFRLRDSNLPVDLLSKVPVEDIIRPLDEFRAHASQTDLYRQHGHFHWTPRAHKIAAQLLSEALLQPLGLGQNAGLSSGR